MLIRELEEYEFLKITELIYDTVHAVCSNDYTEEELSAWAPSRFDEVRFKRALINCFNLVAQCGDDIVGFISVEKNGYINRLFTHKNYLHRGIASRLLYEVEVWAKERNLKELSLDSSKTAEGFYLKRGFYKSGVSVLKHNGVIFHNTVMKKTLV